MRTGKGTGVPDQPEDAAFLAAGLDEFEKEGGAFLGGFDVLGQAAFEGRDVFGAEGGSEREGGEG